MPVVVITRGPWSIDTALITSVVRIAGEPTVWQVTTTVGPSKFVYNLTGSEAIQLDVFNSPSSPPPELQKEGYLIQQGTSITYDSAAFADIHSFQPVSVDLNVGATVGSSSASKFIAPIMGNLIGATLTKTQGYLGGVIGADSVTGAQSTTFQKGAVLGIIFDLVTAATAAVVAIVDGDGGVAGANAAFAFRMNNSTVGSGVDYGLDLFGAAHDGFLEAAIRKAAIRMNGEVCILSGAGVPTDTVTGAGFAEIGSLYMDRTGGKGYINGGIGTKASPVWKIITSA